MLATALPSIETFFSSHEFAFRTKPFQQIAEYLLSLKKPLMIVETGCMRPGRNPGSEWEDGQSTLLWDQLAQMTGGKCFSIELNPANVKYARERVSPSTEIIEGNSLEILIRAKFEPQIDFLYLDSMDYDPGHELESTLHHVGELAAVWKHIASGGMIAVDDCLGPFVGKQAGIRVCLEFLCNIPPYGLGFVSCWKKP